MKSPSPLFYLLSVLSPLFAIPAYFLGFHSKDIVSIIDTTVTSYVPSSFEEIDSPLEGVFTEAAEEVDEVPDADLLGRFEEVFEDSHSYDLSEETAILYTSFYQSVDCERAALFNSC
jgi:hypothetical protein